MAVSANFAPNINLIRATLCGVQVGQEGLFAYDCACDYYGKERVALQVNKNVVEYVHINGLSDVTIAQCKHIEIKINETAGTALSLSHIYEYLRDKHNPDFKSSLFIYWPEVTISNEEDQHIDIKDLFCRVPLFYKGMSFRESEYITFLKTTYTKVQWDCGYIHSHTQPLDSDYMKFRHVCLGTGPIKNTVHTLQRRPTDDMAANLFFWELDKVAHVESLRGVPYFRLSTVTEQEAYEPINTLDRHNTMFQFLKKGKFYKDLFTSFIKATPIPFGFKDGNYVLGCSFTDFAILFSNYYKKWKDAIEEAAKLELVTPSTVLELPLKPYILKDGELYQTRGMSRSERRIPSSPRAFEFNGKSFVLTVIEDTNNNPNYLEVTLVDLATVASLIEFILTSVNAATSKPYEERSEKPKDNPLWEQYSCMLYGCSQDPTGTVITNYTSTLN